MQYDNYIEIELRRRWKIEHFGSKDRVLSLLVDLEFAYMIPPTASTSPISVDTLSGITKLNLRKYIALIASQ